MFTKRFACFVTVVALCATLVVPFSVSGEGAVSVVINELLWMGSPGSSADEWIELRNMGDAAVDVGGWKLTRKSSGLEVTMLVIPAGNAIGPRGFFLISNFVASSASTHLGIESDLVDPAVSLLNSGLEVKLYDAVGTLVDVADDGSGTPLSGKYASGETYASMARNGIPGDGSKQDRWHTSSTSANLKPDSPVKGTPRAMNENVPPEVPAIADQQSVVGATVTFDATDAYDPDGDVLSFMWSFGDGGSSDAAAPTHAYASPGTFSASLEVRDGAGATSVAFTVTVVVPIQAPEPALAADVTPSNTGTVMLNELLPNPMEGGEEYIELYSPDADVGISGWTLSDSGGASYTVPPSTLAPHSGYLEFRRSVTRISLNNDGDSVTLKRPDGSVASKIEYTDADRGTAYARDGGVWAWTTTPTPGMANVVTRVNHAPRSSFSCASRKRVGDLVECTAADTSDPDGDTLSFVWDFGDGTKRTGAVVRHRFKTDGAFTVRLKAEDPGGLSDVEERTVTIKLALTGAHAPKKSQVKGAAVVTAVDGVKDADTSTAVRITGFVSAPPNLLGDGLMYVFDGTSGVAVRSSGTLPKLAIGDAVVVSGERRTKNGEPYVYVTAPDGILRSGDAKRPEPVLLSAGALDAGYVGVLGTLTGDVTGISGSRITVDDGSGEVSVYIRTSTGLKKPALHVGDRVTVVGIVGMTSGGIRLLPRVTDDLRIVAPAAQPAQQTVVVPAVRKPSPWTYAAVIGALAAGVGIGMWRKQRNAPA